MKTLIYDPFSGISGDMHMGAMIDLGVPEEHIIGCLQALNLPGWDIKYRREKRSGISGIRALVQAEGEHPHEHSHEHEHEHHHEHEHSHEYEHSHEHRGFKEIKEIIEASPLSDAVKERSLRMFRLIAEAEAKVHGSTIDEVHFHEVGAVDSIVDIVAAAAAIDYLKPDRILSFPPELGGGFVNCAHGRIPVPAPATVEILKGIACRRGAVDKETTTPTGAAILAANVDEFITTGSYTIMNTGYGLGRRELPIPNALRIYLAETDEQPTVTEALMIECNIDDMNPELYDPVITKLLATGAKEAYLTPVQMKKNRPGTALTVMTTADKRDEILDLIFRETTTGGVREYPVRQTMLERRFETAETQYGSIRLKKFFYKGNCVSCKAEYEEAKALATKHGVSMKEIYRTIRW
ncbi:nickel pincer cofactor biosynthesis protein LarC [Marispirochaeta aestuarii]|uniref:nickel pincer cofactor biosynthesis protein LarC n=1 Tax=Marispirochaeta aestuarii TaxID=1963862 RepID=UPI0029C782A9|nr:nickel pincer cofactor biosynthesis protein LarC [Marispirochaeta aestuarii]